MSEPINHYAKAEEMAHEAGELLRNSVSWTENARAYTQLGQLHLDLHHGQPQVAVSNDPYWKQAQELEDLKHAVRKLIERRDRLVLDQQGRALDADIELLRELVRES